MTSATQATRVRKKLQFSLSDEAREIVAAQPHGRRSQFVEDAIIEKARRALEE